MNILVAGDTHGDSTWFHYLFEKAERFACDRILQVGDFGFWPHMASGLAFLDEVEALTASHDIEVFFIDGNHENHDLLAEASNGVGEVRDGVWWLPRGHRWSWGGVRFGALGGAHSIDWRAREVGVSWWPQEQVGQEDVDRLGDDPLDVLVTHDVPASFAIPYKRPIHPADELRSLESRELIDSAVRATGAELVLAGHWHERWSGPAVGGGCRVEVFAANGMGAEAWGVLTVADGVVVLDGEVIQHPGARP